MMEAKDYWTLGIAAAALLISCGAFIVAGLTYRLQRTQDRRALEAKAPLVEIEAPACDGLGPWPIVFTINNRDEAAIEIVRLLSDERRILMLSYGEPYPVALMDLVDPAGLNFALVNTRVPIGGKLTFTCQAQPYRGKRVGSHAEAAFTIEYRRTVGDIAVQRRVQRIVLNP